MMKEEITCPICHVSFALQTASGSDAHYCPFCRSALYPAQTTTLSAETQKDVQTPASTMSISFLAEHVPASENIQFVIGPYQALHSIGKGGMGEVFLAYDTTCGRRLALKKIRPDLLAHKQLHNRFLKEARITSQLTHPAIIPIYAIHSEADLTYYTMPYVEGETLKQILRKARQQEKNGEKIDPLAQSIPGLIRIFLSICQAVAYAHSKHVLHRDLKPENIIVGQYGRIVILDWGLAKMLKNSTESPSDIADGFTADEEEEEEHPMHHLTHIGRVVGTVSYMAPERAMGNPANFQTDIYALGVILYQLLTLKHPFHRPSLKEFRRRMHQEKLIDPIEIAPYRDVPRSLSRVVIKCLSPNPELRYRAVDELIHDLENYIEGRSEWFQIGELDINNKADWEFQENVLIAEHVALARETEVSNWVSLMISKASFQANIKLQASVKIGEHGHGIGFMLCIPEAAERTHLNDGYCLWLGTDSSKSTKLLRSTVEVMHSPEVFLKRHEWHTVSIEKIENNIHFYLDGILQFSYISHLPLAGTHVGLLARDADFMIKDFFTYIGSQNVTVNCLAVPDAFLAHKDYTTALNEYRRIGYSFPGRAEGREAMFRAGITLLEQANDTEDKARKLELYDLALEEFHRLYNTPGAPLEYLGKALVYQALDDYEEEAKCFELAYRRYPRHPLLPVLQEQIIYRMYANSRHHRQATFNFILLTLRYLPDVATNPNTKKLLANLEKFWEPLFFFENDPAAATDENLSNFAISLKLAFWLARPYAISEIIDDMLKASPFHPVMLGNALFCLLELGCWQLAKAKLAQIAYLHPVSQEFLQIKSLLDIALLRHTSSLEAAVEAFTAYPFPMQSRADERILCYLIEQALDAGKTPLVHLLYQHVSAQQLTLDMQHIIHEYAVWAYLLDKNLAEAGKILHHYPPEQLSQDTTLLHFVYGCWLYVTEGKEIASIHFSGIYEVPYPRTWNLFSYYLKGNIFDSRGWLPKSFLWERRQLFRQLHLFYQCAGDTKKALDYQERIQQEAVDAPTV